MTFNPPPETHATHGWRREGFEIALIGPEAVRHRELLLRAGYGVRAAQRGDQAAQLFGAPEPVDVIVLDFALQGRPPEAILLFSRRTSAAAQLIALVPAQDADAFRRAFLAGARDVLPTPARGEDLLAAVDLLLEPRALATLVDRLRTRYGVDDETIALPPAPGPGGVAPEQLASLEGQIRQLHEELADARARHHDELTRLRQQALDAVTDRDRVLESRNEARERLATARKEQRESVAQLRMMERACEELQKKLKDSRDQGRGLESRLGETKKRIALLEQAMRTYVAEAEREVRLDMEFSEVSAPPDGIELDPEEALEEREEDVRRLDELEAALAERERLAARVSALEAQLDAGTPGTSPDGKELSDLEEALSRRAEDERRLAELDNALEQRRALEGEVERLRRDLGKSDGTDLSEELNELREGHEHTLAILDTVRRDRDSLKRRVADLEREAADALMRIEELQPLVVELEQVRAELRAERDAAMAAKKSAGRAQTRFTQLGRTSAALEDELVATQRGLVLGRARGDVLLAELKNARAALTEAHAARTETLQRLREAELELDSLRVTVAALSADRRSSRART